ncbi:hypothetical protein ANSO36C_00350 [Nostoc cf. commune SO-36]|uniref:NHL repeat-containing protein n=1 Tax=Nostoc cf. commune SO-36 TaxID=449208 RepID=A0ABM7YUD5_NOSCO|nr:hypothetical protein [Nostoc commune]BDI14233.1 hypothetical protein ANSO36C_00350 [Nostoc cf. commune SO-36]
MDEQENVYVADSINSRVQVFDKNGNFLTSYGEPALDASGNPVPPPALTGSSFWHPLDLTPGRFNWTGWHKPQRWQALCGRFLQGRVQVLNVEGTTKVP